MFKKLAWVLGLFIIIILVIIFIAIGCSHTTGRNASALKNAKTYCPL